jgi:hypothetical protein
LNVPIVAGAPAVAARAAKSISRPNDAQALLDFQKTL